MIWGAIAHDWKWPLVCFEAQTQRTRRGTLRSGVKINGEMYCNIILQDQLWQMLGAMEFESGTNAVVVEDNAPIHNSAQVIQSVKCLPACSNTNAFRERLGITRHPHPPSSPDLNPIEALWNTVKHKVCRLVPRANTLEELWAQAQAVWDAIPMEEVNRRIESMETRRRAVLAAKGMHTPFGVGQYLSMQAMMILAD